MLIIKNLHVAVNQHPILKGLDLNILPGTVHAVMGPNGSGKSTLSNVLAGKPGYEVTEGSIEFLGEDLLALKPEERALKGIFLALQYPVEIPGISNLYFLRTALNQLRKKKNEPLLDAVDFMSLAKEKAKQVDLSEVMMNRSVNEGFSGGEKKRNEILQMLLLEPKFVILDETDSGLDIDALKLIASAVNSLRSKDRSFLMVTHYERLLEVIEPDVIHIMVDGKIVKSGNKLLAKSLEKSGYAEYL